MSEVTGQGLLGRPSPTRQSPRRHNKNSSGWSIARWIALVVVAGAVAVVVLLFIHPFGHPAATPGTGPSAGSDQRRAVSGASGAASAGAGKASPPVGPVSERRALAIVARMLAQSATDRRTINKAAADAARCGPNLAADQKAFTDAASSRKKLLAALAALPGRGELPAPMLKDLTDAWQASVSADQPYAQWAADELAQGCVAGATGDRGYQAAVAADGTATAHKAAFTAAWNPLAARYGLTRYQPGQL